MINDKTKFMKDTFEQLIAQSTDRHLAVTANAGSGKTRVLVNRYVDLLLQGIEPSQIAAITFTNKAASEMQAKAAREIDKRFSEAKSEADLRKFKRLRERLTNARISTIGSFCSSILREHPVEAGLIPNYGDLSPAESSRMTDESIKLALEFRLEGDEKEQILSIIDILGFNKVNSLIQLILKKKTIFDALEKAYSGDTADLTDKANKMIYKYYEQDFISELQKLNYVVDSCDKKNIKETAASDFEKLRNNAKQALAEISGGNYDLYKIASNLMDDTNQFFTKNFTLNKNKVKGIKLDESALETANSISFDKFKALPELSENADYDLHIFETSKALFEIAKEADRLYEEEKNNIGMLDFDDLLIKTKSILSIPEVRKRVRSRLKYLLVDEFQDTNEIQYEIIRQIISDLCGEKAGESVNFFMVGDAKQSIYRFRDADVRVFNKARVDIKDVNSVKIQSGELEKNILTKEGKVQIDDINNSYGDLSLNATFRLKPVIAAFTNHICRNIMDTNLSEFEVKYDEFVCARDSDKIQFDSEILDAGTEFGSVSLLISDKKKKDSEQDPEQGTESESENDVEASLLVNFIKNRVHSKDPFYIEEDGATRKAEYKDICILSRSRSGFSELSKILRLENIPFIMHSGKGFFDAPEIIDLIQFLKYIQNVNDDTALVSILRSPFFNLDDNMLFLISRNSGRNFNEKYISFGNCQLYNQLSDEKKYLFSRSDKILKYYTDIAGRISISSLVISFLEDCEWYGISTKYSAGPQMRANIEKFLNYARDFEFRGFNSLAEFVAELEYMRENNSDEGEAVFLTKENAVNIMTMHASKGLEFPIVILYRTDSKGPNNSSTIINEQFGLTFPFNVEDDSSGIRSNKKTPLAFANNILDGLAENAEDKRMLYVAMTRAKDHLAISAEVSGQGGKLFKLLKESLGLDKDHFKDGNENDLTIFESQKFISDGKDCIKKLRFKCNVITSIPEIEAVEPDANDESEITPLVYLDKLKGTLSDELISATLLMNHEKDPLWNYIRSVMGMPDLKGYAINNEIDLDEEKHEDFSGIKYGIYVHKVLENINNWMNSSGLINANQLDNIISDNIGFFNKNKMDLIESIKNECVKVASSNLIKEYLPYLSGSIPEYSLNMPTNNDFLTGTIDLLIDNESGNKEIWDWKTNITSKISETAKSYETQMKFYAYLVSRKFHSQNSFTARLLFTKLAGVTDDWHYTFHWDRAELDDFEKEITGRVDKIKSELIY